MFAGIKILPTFAPAIRKKHGAQQKGRMSDVVRSDDSNEIAEVLEKKVAEKFGSFKNTPYLCTRNLEEIMSREFVTSCSKGSKKKFLKKKCKKIWKFENYFLPLQSVSLPKKNGRETQNKVL